MSAVIDTNVFISAFVFGNLPRVILELAEERSFELFAYVSTLNPFRKIQILTPRQFIDLLAFEIGDR
jgi:predicted nucleic acid-binding protein